MVGVELDLKAAYITSIRISFSSIRISLLLALLGLSNQANPSLDHKTFEKCWKKTLPEGAGNIFDFVKPKIKTISFS